MLIDLNPEEMAKIDSAFWVAKGESYISTDDMPVWNKIRRCNKQSELFYDPVWGIIEYDSPQRGKPRPEPTPCPDCTGVVVTTAAFLQ